MNNKITITDKGIEIDVDVKLWVPSFFWCPNCEYLEFYRGFLYRESCVKCDNINLLEIKGSENNYNIIINYLKSKNIYKEQTKSLFGFYGINQHVSEVDIATILLLL